MLFGIENAPAETILRARGRLFEADVLADTLASIGAESRANQNGPVVDAWVQINGHGLAETTLALERAGLKLADIRETGSDDIALLLEGMDTIVYCNPARAALRMAA